MTTTTESGLDDLRRSAKEDRHRSETLLEIIGTLEVARDSLAGRGLTAEIVAGDGLLTLTVEVWALTDTAAPVARRAPRRWTRAENEELCRMAAQGLPTRQIAARLGRSSDAVQRRKADLLAHAKAVVK